MARRFVITGTDTGVGKTVFSAMLCQVISAVYFKPIQAGLDSITDLQQVQKLTNLPSCNFIREVYRLTMPVSPNIAAIAEGINIDIKDIKIPNVNQPLVVEGAGGVMVPINNNLLFIELFAEWQFPVILCSRTTLGTINHTLLSIDALKKYAVPILGIVFIGEANSATEDTIINYSQVKHLGRLPIIQELGVSSLQEAFDKYFNINDFI